MRTNTGTRNLQDAIFDCYSGLELLNELLETHQEYASVSQLLDLLLRDAAGKVEALGNVLEASGLQMELRRDEASGRYTHAAVRQNSTAGGSGKCR